MVQQGRGPQRLDPYRGTTNKVRAEAIDLAAARQPTPRSAGLTVVVLNLDRPDLLLPLLDRMGEVYGWAATRGLGFEVVVGDTGSTDTAVLDRYRRAPEWLTVLPDLDYHFAGCNNVCVAASPVGYDTVLLLNNDVVLPSPQPVQAMHSVLATHAGVGIVGLRLVFPDGSVQHAGIDIVRAGFRRGLPWHPADDPMPPDWTGSYPALAVTGACLMIRRGLWDELGGLDPAYDSECQDVDLCLAAGRLGHEVRVMAAGPVVHLESQTRGPDDQSGADRRLFLRRWSGFLGANHL